MASNTAAWLPSEKAYPVEVKSSRYNSPDAHQVVVKSGAVAINPVDWAIQAMGNALPFPVQYPYIGGTDVAGEVVEVGSSVTRFKLGNRVVGNTRGVFQQYVVIDDHMTSPIPDTLSYESASVIPLGFSTAAASLFQKSQLALQYPSFPRKSTGNYLLVWGGSTSVGSNAIQLAVAAGYEVISTASAKVRIPTHYTAAKLTVQNLAYLKQLGATQTFDRNSSTVVLDIIAALNGKDFAGAIAIGSVATSAQDNGPAKACIEIVSQSEGAKFVSCVNSPPEDVPEGISAKFVTVAAIKEDGVGRAVYEDFLPRALADGTFVAAPEALVVGKGLESIQAAFATQMKGVSAQKVVVSF